MTEKAEMGLSKVEIGRTKVETELTKVEMGLAKAETGLAKVRRSPFCENVVVPLISFPLNITHSLFQLNFLNRPILSFSL